MLGGDQSFELVEAIAGLHVLDDHHARLTGSVSDHPQGVARCFGRAGDLTCTVTADAYMIPDGRVAIDQGEHNPHQ
jgi:hypothetical protein